MVPIYNNRSYRAGIKIVIPVGCWYLVGIIHWENLCILGCFIWVNAIVNYSDVSTVILYTYVSLWMVYRPEWYQNKNIVEYSYHVGIKNYKKMVFFVPKCYHHWKDDTSPTPVRGRGGTITFLHFRNLAGSLGVSKVSETNMATHLQRTPIQWVVCGKGGSKNRHQKSIMCSKRDLLTILGSVVNITKGFPLIIWWKIKCSLLWWIEILI